jgi:inhibitor of KinA
MIRFRMHRYNEVSILLELEDLTVETSHSCILIVEAHCKDTFKNILTNRIPAYCSLLLTVAKSGGIPDLEKEIVKLLISMKDIPEREPGEEKVIPICYDEQLGNDLNKMSGYLQIEKETIINHHVLMDYRVYMLGFLPGFPYLGFIPEVIAMPRKKEPVATKAGAVGIAGQQTGIYPVDSPGGWQIVGYTPMCMFDVTRKNPALLLPGQRVRFEAINLETYFKLK